MPIPSNIEIVPVKRLARAAITVPGSKSVTNRALVLAALGAGRTILRGALWSEDTQVMVEALRTLGFSVSVTRDPDEPCNRTIAVDGLNGEIPRASGDGRPVELYVGNAGTAARFLAALVCLGDGAFRLHGIPRMHERPQDGLFQALEKLGYRVDSPNGRLPATVYGAGSNGGACRVSIGESSQFASALILCARAGRWKVSITGANAGEAPYVNMTHELVNVFPETGGEFQIEPDASSGSYFWAAGWLRREAEDFSVTVAHWPKSGWQIDSEFPKFLPLPPVLSRKKDLGDSIMTAVVLAPFARQSTRFEDLGRLRVQECERVGALRTELARCGGKVHEDGDTLRVDAAQLHGAEIETYNDHRMAMCFAILGLKVTGIRIKNPACVRKTFPNFFQKLSLAPPDGLGVQVLDAATGKRLGENELFAD